MEFDFLGGFFVNVGEAVLDEVDGAIVEVFEVVRGEVEVVAPVKAEPFHVGFDGLDVFGFLFFWIGIVKAEMAFRTGVLASDAEVEADGFRVPDVQVAVRLRRETGDGGFVFSGREIGGDDFPDEVEFCSIGHVESGECRVSSDQWNMEKGFATPLRRMAAETRLSSGFVPSEAGVKCIWRGVFEMEDAAAVCAAFNLTLPATL